MTKIKTLPRTCIGVDVIVGLPVAMGKLFLETYRLLNELGVSHLQVFTCPEQATT